MDNEMLERPVYAGWRLYRRVKIIESAYDSNKIYIADASDKRQIETGRKWARKRVYDYENQKYIETEGKEYEFDNAGFTLELSSSPSSSWRGGKLSVCMCTVRKDGHTWQTGISSDLLIDLLKQSDCIKGVVQGNIAFARKNGQVGMVLIGSESYKEALQDAKIRKTASKTSKALPGHEHFALQVSNTWMFDVYDWTRKKEALVKEIRNFGRWRDADKIIPYLVISDNPVKRHIFPETYKVEKYFKDTGNSITSGEILLNAVKAEAERYKNSLYNDLRSLPIFEYWFNSNFGVTKFPARSVGSKLFTATITAEQFNEFKQIVAGYTSEKYESRNSTMVNYFNIASLACLAGVSLNEDKSELPDVGIVRDWVENFDDDIIVEYFGEVIMSNKLKTALEKREYFDLRLPKDM